MNKTFKRVLASMLAILMIICSMPFTVFAAENNRKWWVDDGVDPATITSEPEFWGFNSDTDPVHQPMGPWGLSFGSKVDFEADLYEDHRDDWKPVLGVTVSDVGTKGAATADLTAKYQNNYAANTSRSFEAAKADGTIINPAELKAGQRIAVTFEMGGFDILNNGQIVGNYDSDFIKPGSYTRAPSGRGDGWVTATGASAWKTSNALYASKGDALGFGGANTDDTRFLIGIFGTAFGNGERLASNYIGMNNEERGFDSGYGLVIGTVFFEVQQDCDLKDVMTLSGRQDGCIVEPICRDVFNDGVYVATINDFKGAFANMPVVWTNYSNGGSEACDHANKTTTKTVEKAATCTETGLEKVVVTCDDCGVVVSEDTNTIEKLAHTEKVVAGTPATCTSTGLTDGKVCEVCGTVLEAQEEIAMLEHTKVEIAAVAATCTEGGKTAGVKCSVCDTVIVAPQDTEALGHNYVEVEGSAVAPTVDAAGKEADQQCTRCDDVIAGAAIPALASYEITVAATDLGVITLNGADVTDGAKVKVEAGSTVTLTAEPIEGAKFLGWTANGLTTVSTDTTFTTVALANVTYTPVFEKADAASFTVVFADAFGNIVSSQVVTDGSQIVIPDAPARSGYVAATENGWTMTNEEIQALTSSATVIAVYELAENEGYTVTANGATITGDGIEATDVATGVAYDTLVTVYKEGAKGWAVNGVTVAYGDTYSFYVGKDIEVVAVMDGVTAVPMVANVGVNEVGQPGRIQAQFIATRTMADGYTYIDSGFVYGKGDLGEITLFDVDGSAVKAAYTKTASEQFSVTYGLSAQTGTITARAFIAYANADGEVTVTYGAPMTYQYK